MIVTRSQLPDVTARLAGVLALACDTETTGLKCYTTDRPFSVILSDGEDSWYFNFNEYEDCNGDDERVLRPDELAPIFAVTHEWYFQNTKFDVSQLENVGLTVRGETFDLKVMARLVNNQRMFYSLEALAACIGEKKDKSVEEYIKAHGLYATGPDGEKLPQYARVPLDIIVPYGCQDGRITYRTGVALRQAVAELAASYDEAWPKLEVLHTNERRLLRVVQRMERFGAPVDRPYCQRAARHELGRIDFAQGKFEELTGHPYKNSNKLFAEVFKDERLTMTEPTARFPQGQPSFAGEIIDRFEHPAAKCLVEMRDAKSRWDTYQALQRFSADDGRIHADFDQTGTDTGRFSSSKPNLQNLRKEKGAELAAEYVVRRALVPPPGCFFSIFDMDQAEYRLMLDYAGAMELIAKILGGLDVHQATALLAGIDRQVAKNGNFATLYGSGDVTMARTCGITVAEARRVREAILRGAPEVGTFVDKVKTMARTRGWVFNWAGRKLICSRPNLSYKMPNHVIQSGVGDIAKFAMVQVDEMLEREGFETRLCLQVHDEVVYAVPVAEKRVQQRIHEVLKGAYKHKHLPITWGVSHSHTSFADKVEGFAA